MQWPASVAGPAVLLFASSGLALSSRNFACQLLEALGHRYSLQTGFHLQCRAQAHRFFAKDSLSTDARRLEEGTEFKKSGSKRTRHVKVKYLYVQDLVKAREIEVSRVATETNLADMGTKHLPSHRLEFL